MRIGLVMDATCDLPLEFVQKNNITVLPILVNVEGETFADQRDPVETQRFLDSNMGSRSHGAETTPYSSEEVMQLFMERLVIDFDCVFCFTITATRSPVFEQVNKASFAILKNYRPARQEAGVPGPFLMRVIDTQTLFAGSAIPVIEAVRLLETEQSPGQMRERLEQVAQNTHGFLIPRDLNYLRQRARKRGDRSIGLVGATLGSALDIKPILRGWRGNTEPMTKVRSFEGAAETLFKHIEDRIRHGLMVPVVSLSYGGDLDVMHHLPGYDDLRRTCSDHGIDVMECPMSITGMANTGQGGLCAGFASEPYEANF
ncbi:DegV family protein [Oleiagrimonas soli]|uniref:DegV domain-containing protein n=1 Tax=Oleiagrimonas soli TaxID=1543381 RepID=A0A099CYX3_9GAMM|nr:DegV family protein [Oleiagrimonas soli]KGI78817.1 DegV domain-containing protein [Oleiagrimonas soli]MBB6184400.1 DegV family protein with EDD domain [Oleiagrimonas soli]